jgi:hypothetical protein
MPAEGLPLTVGESETGVLAAKLTPSHSPREAEAAAASFSFPRSEIQAFARCLTAPDGRCSPRSSYAPSSLGLLGAGAVVPRLVRPDGRG